MVQGRPILVLILVAILVVGGCRGSGRARVGSPAAGTDSASEPAGGDPAGPLPAPLSLPAGSPDEAASELVGRILGGGQEGLSALLAALQAAGIAVRGPDGHLAVQPANLGQGLAVSAWEARFMAGLVGKGRTLLVPLTALREVLVRAAPELQGEPVAQHILEGIRAHAQGSDGPVRAWARLIVELGRQRQTGGAQDLLGPVDPSAVRLDAVQLSLITVRLVGDLAALEGQAAQPRRDVVADGSRWARSGVALARRMAGLGGWLAPGPAYAAQPCTEESPVISREKVSAGGFDVLKGILRERVSKSLLGRVRRQIRDYNTLALVLAALRIDVAMDPPGPPLVRTKTTDPGEERTITARVSLDPKVLGTVECAQALLAALGLKFNVANPAGGGVEGIPVHWRLVQGHNELLEQAGADDVTDRDGSDTFKVLGRPQERDLGASARQVGKQGAVAVRFDLRPYALLGTTPGPGGPLTPPEALLDLSYGYEVTYPFDIVDWTGEGPWTGTITYTREEVRQISGQTEKSGVNGDQTSTLRITVTLGETEWESGDPSTGASMIMVRGTARGEYSLRGRTRGWYKTDCWTHKGVMLHSTMEEQMSGAGSGSAKIAITVTPTNYVINVASDDGFEAAGRAVGRGDQCQGGGITQVSTSHALGPVPLGLGIPMTFGRDIAAGDAGNVLQGRLTDTKQHVDADNPGNRTTTTWIISWDLRRR